MRYLLTSLLVGALVLIAIPAPAADRLDFFDTRGRREGTGLSTGSAATWTSTTSTAGGSATERSEKTARSICTT